MSLKKVSKTCPECGTSIEKAELSFSRFVLLIAISLLVMAVGMSSVLFYLGFGEIVAKYVGLALTFVMLWLLMVSSMRWSVSNLPSKRDDNSE